MPIYIQRPHPNMERQHWLGASNYGRVVQVAPRTWFGSWGAVLWVLTAPSLLDDGPSRVHGLQVTAFETTLQAVVKLVHLPASVSRAWQ